MYCESNNAFMKNKNQLSNNYEQIGTFLHMFCDENTAFKNWATKWVTKIK